MLWWNLVRRAGQTSGSMGEKARIPQKLSCFQGERKPWKWRRGMLAWCFIFTSYVVATPTWFSNKIISLLWPPKCIVVCSYSQEVSFQGRFSSENDDVCIFFIYFSLFSCPCMVLNMQKSPSPQLPKPILHAVQSISGRKINCLLLKMQIIPTTEIILPLNILIEPESNQVSN